VVVNLAITVSMTNAKVLLIDCDLRKPRMHRFFKYKSIPGLSNYLLGENDLDSIIKKTEIPNLHVIYAGAIPPNPVELLDSKVFQEMMDTLSQSYEYIFIDCPPLLEVTDALVVSKLCSGTVLVARQKYTTHRFIHQALKKLDFANAKVLGFVLNDVPKKKNKYYYRYIT
jgi:succinoglycan biosynthesis transport protein ExoP